LINVNRSSGRISRISGIGRSGGILNSVGDGRNESLAGLGIERSCEFSTDSFIGGIGVVNP